MTITFTVAEALSLAIATEVIRNMSYDKPDLRLNVFGISQTDLDAAYAKLSAALDLVDRDA